MKKIIRIIVYCLWVNSVLAQEECHIAGFGVCPDISCDVLIVDEGVVYEAGSCDIKVQKLVVNGTLKTGSGTIECETLTINGKLATAQKGKIKINGDVEINGSLIDTVNVQLEIGGNLTCNGALENIVAGNFKLLGENKGLYGNIRALHLEVGEGATYTNHGTVEITNYNAIPTFTGTGTFIQGKNALLITHAESSSVLDASAEGNTVRFVRNGKITISCTEFYNIECTTVTNQRKKPPVFSLMSNTIINGSLRFSQRCFLDLQGNTLTFPQWTEKSIVQDTLILRGIILSGGTIQIDEIPSETTVHIPLCDGKDISDFAHVEFTNNGANITNLKIEQWRNTTLADSDDDIPFIPFMYKIVSQCGNGLLRFYWHKDKENKNFEHDKCRVKFLNGDTWEMFDANTPAQQSTIHGDIYYVATVFANNNNNAFTLGITSGDNPLPVSLTHFSVTKQTCQNVLMWETASELNCDYFVLLKSVDGLNFYPCASIAGNGTSSFAHKYAFYDKEQSAGVTYYQLAQYDYDGTVWKSNIISAPVFENSATAALIRKSNTHCVVQTANNEQCFVTDRSGRIVANFTSNTLYDFSHFTAGIYFVNAEHSQILDNWLIVR